MTINKHIFISDLFTKILSGLFVFSFLFFHQVHAQVIQKEIYWFPKGKQQDVFYEDEHFFQYLNFDNAAYPDKETYLPYYGGIVPVSTVDADIIVKGYESEEYVVSEFRGIDSIPSSLQVNTAVRMSKGKYYLHYSFIPLYKESGQIMRIISFDFEVVEGRQSSLPGSIPLFKDENNSVLASGEWHKISVTKSGIYKISYEQLLDWGIDNPSNVGVFGYGGMLSDVYDGSVLQDLPQLPVYIEKGSDGILNAGDYILVYLEGPDIWSYNAGNNMFMHEKNLYSDKAFYFITSSLSSKEIGSASPVILPANIEVNSFDDYDFHEKNNVHIIKSGQEIFESLTINFPFTYSFSFSNPDFSKQGKFYIRSMVKSSGSNSYVRVNAGNSQFDVTMPYLDNWSGTQNKALEKKEKESFSFSSSRIDVTLLYQSNDPTSNMWLDYFILNIRRHLTMSGTQLLFRDIESVENGNVVDFFIDNVSEDIMVWDITSIHSSLQVHPDINSGQAVFRAYADTLREYVAFYPEQVSSSVSYVEKIDNQNIRREQVPELLILVKPSLKTYANQLASLRISQGVNTLVLEPEQVYNEFSSGAPHPAAIRNMLKMFFDRSSGGDTLRYFLLFGDGSYSSKEASKGNRLLTYQTKNSISEINSLVADDYFGLLSHNEGLTGLLDIAVGRLPVNTGEEAHVLISKIKQYEQDENKGDWRNKICFIGDDGDNNLHMKDVDRIAKNVEEMYPAFDLTKIMLDAYPRVSTPSGGRYPSVSEDINNRIHNGLLLMVYLGHGGGYNLSHERIIDMGHVRSWKNTDKSPFFVTASCEVTRFDDHTFRSLGEFFVLAEGGAMGSFSTTRKVYANENYLLISRFVDHLLNPKDDEQPRTLGEAMMLAKNAVPSAWRNNRSFHLFADPSMELGYPVPDVTVTGLNGQLTVDPYDTLRALEKVSITGQVLDEVGQRNASFNGDVSIHVFDRENTITTLSNKGNTPFVYKTRNSLLYKGRASVNSGNFEISFIVPKDMSYSYMNGKISLYAKQPGNQFHGYYKDFVLGGTSDSAKLDNLGPEIKMYMNNENFVSGGITNENPLFVAELFDSSGINTVGNGIGHDLMLTINDEEGINLNEYYVSDLNTYQSGRLEYQLSNLLDGTHTAKLKVWDVHNNSSEGTIDFIVAKSEELSLTHLFNYPNPFTTFTSFYFEHNQPNTSLDVIIQIFTISGKLIKTIRTEVFSEGYNAPPISWDGLDDFGDRIGRGVYVYRLKAKSEKGKVEEKLERLVILR